MFTSLFTKSTSIHAHTQRQIYNNRSLTNIVHLALLGVSVNVGYIIEYFNMTFQQTSANIACLFFITMFPMITNLCARVCACVSMHALATTRGHVGGYSVCMWLRGKCIHLWQPAVHLPVHCTCYWLCTESLQVIRSNLSYKNNTVHNISYAPIHFRLFALICCFDWLLLSRPLYSNNRLQFTCWKRVASNVFS